MRLKLIAAALAFSTAMVPAEAHALAITAALSLAGGFLTQMGLAGIGGAVAGLTGSFSAGAFALGWSVAGAVGGTLVSTALNFGLNALFNRSKPTGAEIGATTRSSAPVRRLLFGRLRVAGNLFFTGVTKGLCHYGIHHGDSPCATVNHWFLDTPVDTTEDGWVTTKKFKGPWANNFFQIDARDGALDHLASAVLMADYPEWDADHRGIGCAYTVIKGAGIKYNDRHKVFKHDGPLGSLGVPAYFREADWGTVYDPRKDSTRIIAHDGNGNPVMGGGPQRAEDPSTWSYDDNAALIIATFRIHRDGWAKPPSSVNWEMIAKAADISDQIVVGRDDYESKRYTLATIIPFNERRIDAEMRMLEACDGMRFVDDQGRWFLRVGAYEEPSVTLGPRAVIRIRQMPNADGESDHNAYVTSYTDPRLLFTDQPCAPWYHPDHFEEGVTPVSTAAMETPEVGNHNQAVRICKAVGTRSRSPKRVEMVANWYGLRLRPERFVRLNLGDAVLDDIYEIMGYEESPDGMMVNLVLVKTDAGNWDLLPDEEGPLPSYDNDLTPDSDVPVPTGFFPYAVQVPVSGGFGVRLEALFDVPANPSYIVTVEWKRSVASVWTEMVSVTDQGRAYADVLANDGEVYDLRAYMETSGGEVSNYTATVKVTATADITPTDDLVSATSTGGAGTIDYAWTAPDSANYFGVKIWRGLTGVFDDASLVRIEPGLLGQPDSYQETGVPPGDHYTWLVPLNKSQVPGTAVAHGPITVT
jgi:hypothetical protein